MSRRSPYPRYFALLAAALCLISATRARVACAQQEPRQPDSIVPLSPDTGKPLNHPLLPSRSQKGFSPTSHAIAAPKTTKALPRKKAKAASTSSVARALAQRQRLLLRWQQERQEREGADPLLRHRAPSPLTSRLSNLAPPSSIK